MEATFKATKDGVRRHMLVEAWKGEFERYALCQILNANKPSFVPSVGLWAIICEVTEVNNSREASSRTACRTLALSLSEHVRSKANDNKSQFDSSDGESAALSHSEEPPHSDQPLVIPCCLLPLCLCSEVVTLISSLVVLLTEVMRHRQRLCASVPLRYVV